MSCTFKLRTDSLQGKAIQFFQKQGKPNIGKILDEGSITLSSKRIKDSSKILSMLEDVSDDFKKHGMFIHQGDENIMRANADLLENMLDPTRLVTRINEKAKQAGFKHNVIGAKKFNGYYWLKMADEGYSAEYSKETHDKRMQNIIKRNTDYINKVNKRFESVTGQKAITLVPSGNGIRIDINENTLKDFNSQSYQHYVNYLMSYMNNNEPVEEDFMKSPIIHKLEVEKGDLIKEKQRLNSSGAKKSVINTVDNNINELDRTISKLENNAALEDVWAVAETDFADIEILLNQKSITPAQFDQAKRKLEAWVQSGDFSNENHLYLDSEELENDYYREQFRDISVKAVDLMRGLKGLGQTLLEKVVNNALNAKDRIPFHKILQLPHKLNLFHKHTLSLNRVGQALAQFIHKTVNEANSRAHIESKIQARTLADIYKKVKDSGFDLDLFYQEDSEGVKTGRLRSKFSDYFYKNLRKMQNVDMFRRNMLMLNPKLLFEGTELEKETAIIELREHLGDKGVQKYITQAKDKYEEYKEIKEEFLQQEFGGEPTTEEDKAVKDEWIRDNSPIQRIQAITKTKAKTMSNVQGKNTFLVTVPRRTYKTGKQTKWYDSKFAAIEENDYAYEFYNAAEEITHKTKSAYGGSGFLTMNSLAFIERDLVSKWNESGVAEFLTKDVYDNLVGSLTTSELSPTVTDPITGKPIKKVRGDLSGLDSKIRNKYEDLLASETRVPLTAEIKLDLRAQASEEVFNENKDNLFMTLNLMNLSALSLQHKHNIEDLVNMALTYVPNSQVRMGNDYIDSAGNPVAEKYIENMKEMIEHFLDMSYYSEGKKDTSSTLFRIRSRKEKERAAVLEERLSQPGVTDKNRVTMENELEGMGKRVTLDILARKLLDFIRIKGLGWNIPAAIANLTYGKLTNLYKAVDGRLFNTRELGKAERLMITENKKFNHVVENYSILGDILFEFKDDNKFEEKKNWFFKAIKSLKPYAMQTSTEKSNQGSIMIAMMLRQKVKNSETGEELSMWEAINKEGKLSDAWALNNRVGTEAVVEMVSRIKSQVEEIHGDYSNPLMIKKTLPGQALGMFKMWFFEAVHNRIGEEREDYVRGITTKGTWRTLANLIKSHKLQFRKLYKDYKSGKLSEVDAANMRVNLLELSAYVLSAALYGLMKAGICGDSKTCKNANAAQLFILNTSKRLSNEISFWVPGPHSLKEWYKFISNPTAAANLLNDMYNLVEVVGIMIDEDQENDYYTKGFYEGRHKGMVWVEKQLPAINQLQRVRKYSSEFLNL